MGRVALDLDRAPTRRVDRHQNRARVRAIMRTHCMDNPRSSKSLIHDEILVLTVMHPRRAMYPARREPYSPMTHHIASTGRLEAFSDGVIAVIITIMVLELKIPRQQGYAGLLAILPILAVYLLSFTFTGIYWINHHHLVHRTEETDPLILYANLGFLFCLSLLPFFTSYLLDKKMDSFSVAMYTSSMVLSALSFFLLRVAIGRRLRIAGRLEPEDTAIRNKHWMSMLLYLIAIPIAFVHAHLALGITAVVTLIWITPTIGVKPDKEHFNTRGGAL